MSALLDLLEESYRASMTEKSLIVAMTTLVGYDYMLTFSDEIQYMWSYKTSAITVLLLLLRYVVLFRQALRMTQFLHLDILADESYVWCDAYGRMWTAVDVFAYLTVVALASLRIYAISVRHNNIKAFLVLAFGTAFAICDAYGFNIAGRYIPAPLHISGCWNPRDNDEPAVVAAVLLIGTVCMLISELLVQIFTWERTFSVWRVANTDGTRQPLLLIVLRDGTLAYISFVIWTIITWVVTSVDLPDTIVPGLAIAISRILLRIRRTQHTSSSQNLTTVNIRQSQILDTTQIQMYFSEADNEDAIPGENHTYLSDC